MVPASQCHGLTASKTKAWKEKERYQVKAALMRFAVEKCGHKMCLTHSLRLHWQSPPFYTLYSTILCCISAFYLPPPSFPVPVHLLAWLRCWVTAKLPWSVQFSLSSGGLPAFVGFARRNAGSSGFFTLWCRVWWVFHCLIQGLLGKGGGGRGKEHFWELASFIDLILAPLEGFWNLAKVFFFI